MKRIWFCIALCAATNAFAAKFPLVFTSKPSFPQSALQNASSTISYTLLNNTPVTLPLSFSASVSAGTITPNGGTCGTRLSSHASCTKTFLFTAPTGQQTVTGTISVNYNGRCPLVDNSLNFTVQRAVIRSNVSQVLFSFNDANASGTMGTGQSVITITNTGSVPALSVNAISPLPPGISQSATTCPSSLAPNASCTITFTTATTPDSTKSISIKGVDSNTLTLPIAPLSIRVYSPPVNPNPSNASLMLVNTCLTPQLLAITNNSSNPITNITLDNSAFPLTTTDLTHCPSSLGQNQTCVLGITANAQPVNTSGNNFLLGWNGGVAQGAIYTGVEATGASLPDLSIPTSPVTAFGGYVYDKNNTCNTVKLAALVDQYTDGNTPNTPPTNSIAWTTPPYQTTIVPDPGTGAGFGARSITDGQSNTTAIIFQASPGSNYSAGYCAQYVEASAGNNYVGWYLPALNELTNMRNNLSPSGNRNGFDNTGFYWTSSEESNITASVVRFSDGTLVDGFKNNDSLYFRCSRSVTY